MLLFSLHCILPFFHSSRLFFIRDGLVLSQREEAERKRLLFQCESDPTAIHGLPQLRRALQDHRSQCLRDSGMTFSHSCITVEPAVGLCAFLSVVPRVTRAVSPIQLISPTVSVFYILICSFRFADLLTLHSIWISQIPRAL